MTSATGDSGFTLLELLVVLAILVLLAGAWPFAAARMFPTQQLRNETHQLIAALRSARTRARATGVIQSVEIAPSAALYTSGAETHQLPKGVQLHIRAPEMNLSSNRLAFYPDGSSSGAILDLTLFHRTTSIVVGSLTGRTNVLP